MPIDPSVVEQVRDASRTMVRELGFMRKTLAGTEYSASAVHSLLEIDSRGPMTAVQLVQVLGLEKSSVSRMIAKLVEAQELVETAGDGDARTKRLNLTEKGVRTVSQIHAYGREQVTTALARLNTSQQQAVAQGLTSYAQALKVFRLGTEGVGSNTIRISAGYRPGLIGRIVEMHAAFYFGHAGFGQFFESQVAAGVAEFAGRLNEPCNDVWVATQGDRIVGSVAIDGQDLGSNQAHLRWFILDEGCRGSGVGRRLLKEAIDFCDQQDFAAIQLWTFKGLDAARRLYESFGFELTHEEQGEQWGTVVTEQQFSRRRS
ncbi:bifunctional helix-turn-helix transcriptional regulator/GNAT family N-acetyltransferase [Pseudomonas fuscovaginae UPB0736]|uniref:bifunctional helix-turn-helix transcriptional regulator/GNAT family N-acetyltransferase n=1 Tax=Pseudomonas asplenii TaxID=53407 RepID=UPI000289AB8D|nr:bifunctional helix-turn-helix transcriptional regulator/GNAT family N-acetyltransferase [Pseudomonas fuscovaginae]UUQ64517.1 bifunctional helix-turn-helix transcriptional regulator/GNAT family N-acetyltransferase [Pseudomonas fuscovaginae UPB0736]